MLMFIVLSAFAIASAEWVPAMENPGMFEGDIVLDPDEREGKLKGNAFASIKGGRWPNARIPYYIESSIGSTGRQVIQNAINEYHRYTCLRFYPRRSERSYISFYYGRGCSSPVGYRYGRVNKISLANGCQYKGTAMHEIGHSIGLYHEQSRPDRDYYVRILWNNIPQGNQFNFQKYTTRTIDSLRTPYDFRSMMHYGSTAFGGGRTTIQTIDSRNQKLLGQRGGFSSIDIQQINKMYCCKLIAITEQTMKLLKSFCLKLLGNFDLKNQREIRENDWFIEWSIESIEWSNAR